jgi:hypothetical protein
VRHDRLVGVGSAEGDLLADDMMGIRGDQEPAIGMCVRSFLP